MKRLRRISSLRPKDASTSRRPGLAAYAVRTIGEATSSKSRRIGLSGDGTSLR